MKFAEDNREGLIKAYKLENKSTYDIAEEFNTYPNKILRALKYLGVKVRSRSSAQANALQTGRHKHPTKGTTRSEETKYKISEGVARHWGNMSDEERQRRSEQSKEKWDAMSDHDKHELRRKAAEAVLRASREGSKVEKFLFKSLTDLGYEVSFHKRGLIDEKFEIDLYLPELKTIIEIDGPTHFLPIWGEETLQKTIKADAQKSGLVLGAGYVMIRIKDTSKTVTYKHNRDVLNHISKELEKIKQRFPKKGNRYIEFEV
tara:strand:- start:3493 stop:4272 length:780 start_codon:yes stop_codon:yes gene_type:complete